MMDDKEVRAEVKLAFTNINGQSMVCTRSMLMTVKRTTSTFKTLEGQLLLMNRGERSTVSTKCAELDFQVPQFLGVPGAILEYVIFCHQEESLWPLSEPSILKKRFDEIFQALRFTKAVENLKVIKKELGVEVKLLEQSVKHLKIDKERAGRVREKLNYSRETIKKYLDETKSIQTELKEITKQSDVLFKSNQEFQKTLSSFESLRHTRASINDQLSRIQNTTKLLPDSDDELNYKISNFQALIRETSKRVESIKSQISEKTFELKSMRNDQNSLVGEEAQLKSKKLENEKNVQSRQSVLEEVFEKFNLSNDDPKILESQLQRSFDQFESKVEKLELEFRSKEQEAGKRLEALLESRLKYNQRKEYILTDIKTHEKEIRTLQAKISSLQTNEGDIEYEKTSLKSLEEKLQKLKSTTDLEALNQIVKFNNVEIVKIENEIEELNKEVSSLHKQSDTHAKLSLLKEELNFKSTALKHLLASNEPELIKNDIPLDNLAVIDEKFDKLQKEISQQKQTVGLTSKTAADIESSIKYKENAVKQFEHEILEAEGRFSEKLQDESVEEYDEILAAAESDYKTALENLKMSSTTTQFNETAIKTAEDDHCCYLCLRKYEDNSSLAEFIERLKAKANAELEDRLKEDLEGAKQYLSDVHDVATDVDRIKTTRVKLSVLVEEIFNENEELASVKETLIGDTKALDSLSNKLEGLESLKSPLNEIRRLKNDLENVQNQLDEKTEEMSIYGFTTRTLDDLESAQKQKNAELKEVRKKVSSALETKDLTQRELSILEGNVKDKRLRISNMERSLMEKHSLDNSIEEYRSKIEELSKLAVETDSLLASTNSDIVQVEQEVSALKESNESDLKSQKATLNSLETFKNEISFLNSSIGHFIDVENPKLKEVQDQLRSLTSKIDDTEVEISELSELVNMEEKRLGNTSQEERNLRDNLDYRELQSKLRETEDEIENLDISQAEASRERYENQSEELRRKYSNLSADLAGKMGEVKQIEDQVKQNERELRTEFKDIDESYKKELAKFRFKSVALSDADTYSKAIDTAIINFHTIKMKETNKIIDDLWKATYSGTDVDTIKIRSDASSTGAKSNRSYNYRVVMVKNDVELDMRGRCSAGQKVLASIIIRLALAECFGTNCGVIALDEPTTNLDTENIESLARSLSNIIELRQSQKNFQLIVITHDEKFLNAMNASKYTDHFYRIRRNHAQKSEIEWVRINRVSE